jgi:hypothetical protein
LDDLYYAIVIESNDVIGYLVYWNII